MLFAGTIRISGKTVAFQQDFVVEVNFLASQLLLSELYAAQLLSAGMSRQPLYGNRPGPDTAIIIYHEERLAMLACLQLIFDPRIDSAVGPLEILARFGQELQTSHTDLGGGKQGTLAERVMVDLDATKATLSHQKAAISALTTGQPLPPSYPQQQQQSGGAGVNLEMLQLRASSLTVERQSLAHVLFLMAYSRKLRKKEIQELVRWLARQTQEMIDGDEAVVGHLVA